MAEDIKVRRMKLIAEAWLQSDKKAASIKQHQSQNILVVLVKKNVKSVHNSLAQKISSEKKRTEKPIVITVKKNSAICANRVFFFSKTYQKKDDNWHTTDRGLFENLQQREKRLQYILHAIAKEPLWLLISTLSLCIILVFIPCCLYFSSAEATAVAQELDKLNPSQLDPLKIDQVKSQMPSIMQYLQNGESHAFESKVYSFIHDYCEKELSFRSAMVMEDGSIIDSHTKNDRLNGNSKKGQCSLLQGVLEYAKEHETKDDNSKKEIYQFNLYFCFEMDHSKWKMLNLQQQKIGDSHETFSYVLKDFRSNKHDFNGDLEHDATHLLQIMREKSTNKKFGATLDSDQELEYALTVALQTHCPEVFNEKEATGKKQASSSNKVYKSVTDAFDIIEQVIHANEQGLNAPEGIRIGFNKHDGHVMHWTESELRVNSEFLKHTKDYSMCVLMDYLIAFQTGTKEQRIQKLITAFQSKHIKSFYLHSKMLFNEFCPLLYSHNSFNDYEYTFQSHLQDFVDAQVQGYLQISDDSDGNDWVVTTHGRIYHRDYARDVHPNEEVIPCTLFNDIARIAKQNAELSSSVAASSSSSSVTTTTIVLAAVQDEEKFAHSDRTLPQLKHELDQMKQLTIEQKLDQLIQHHANHEMYQFNIYLQAIVMEYHPDVHSYMNAAVFHNFLYSLTDAISWVYDNDYSQLQEQNIHYLPDSFMTFDVFGGNIHFHDITDKHLQLPDTQKKSPVLDEIMKRIAKKFLLLYQNNPIPKPTTNPQHDSLVLNVGEGEPTTQQSPGNERVLSNKKKCDNHMDLLILSAKDSDMVTFTSDLSTLLTAQCLNDPVFVQIKDSSSVYRLFRLNVYYWFQELFAKGQDTASNNKRLIFNKDGTLLSDNPSQSASNSNVGQCQYLNDLCKDENSFSLQTHILQMKKNNIYDYFYMKIVCVVFYKYSLLHSWPCSKCYIFHTIHISSLQKVKQKENLFQKSTIELLD
ncbi:hypothetical protein RFI_05084 [Reticulomyxa filosa]|uniref:Uncharacterized protein n=1 Tax=Reticulomyxa filosa TaxID=46433 RepID=X6P1B6_RETFI|nr:hypothetical protein RFI_05084 [Reticulomyxa filosa]|eukprot:ETO32036.1 hypothetical protein RFI_05084 [Reticulomyxa filosa]